MFAGLTTIKNKHDEPKQPLVVTDPSDTEALYDSDNDSLQHPDNSDSDRHQSQHPYTTTSLMETATQASFLDYPPHQGAPSPDTQPGPSKKVELQGTNESFVPVSPFTPFDCSTKMEVEIETVSSDSYHPSDAQLRDSKDATGTPSTTSKRGSTSLLPPANIQTPTTRCKPHVHQANRHLFRSLHAVYSQSDPSQPIEEEEDDDDDTEEEEDNRPTNAMARYPSWSDRGEHPGVGWILNNPLSAEFYKIVISDPTITTTSLMIAPYVTYSLQPHCSEVSATYGKGYCYILTLSLCHALIFLLTCVLPARFPPSTGLISDLAAISILSSYIPLCHVTHLSSFVQTFPCVCFILYL